jgi:hypothetical protein
MTGTVLLRRFRRIWLRLDASHTRIPYPGRQVRLLVGVMLLSGIGRLISLVRNGRPHWFQRVLTTIEFVVPAVFFGLDRATPGRVALPYEPAARLSHACITVRRRRQAATKCSCDGILGGSPPARAHGAASHRRPCDPIHPTTSPSCGQGLRETCVWSRPPMRNLTGNWMQP